jgi:hypothetical protein
LFDADKTTGWPTSVAKSLIPQWNSLAMFAVSPVSFHQVAEVLACPDGNRLSIGGWFHGKELPRPEALLPRPPRFVLPEPYSGEASDSEGPGLDFAILAQFVHPKWLSILASSTDMADHFAENGNIELAPFLREDFHSEVMKALHTQAWQHVGPAHYRSYKVARACHCESEESFEGLPHAQAADRAPPLTSKPFPLRKPDSELAASYEAAASSVGGAMEAWNSQNGILPDAAVRLWQLMRSQEFSEFLSAVTGAGAVSEWAVEARAFNRGDYTLVTDAAVAKEKRRKAAFERSDDSEAKRAKEESDAEEVTGFSIEACLCLAEGLEGDDDTWPEPVGGYTVALTAEEEIATVEAKANALSILGLPVGATTFVKYLNKDCPGARYDVKMVMRMEDDDDDDE